MIRIFKRWYFVIVCTFLPAPQDCKPPALVFLQHNSVDAEEPTAENKEIVAKKSTKNLNVRVKK